MFTQQQNNNLPTEAFTVEEEVLVQNVLFKVVWTWKYALVCFLAL